MDPALPLAPLLPDPALAAHAWTLEAPWPHERRSILRDEAAALVDGLLVRVARGRGALDVAIGEALLALCEGDRLLTLGPSSLGDHAREALGMSPSTARKLVRLARELRDRPLLAAAVRSGEVTARKAETVLPLARGADEARWVERARTDTVRALALAVRAERAGSAPTEPAEPEEPERLDRLDVKLSPEGRATLDEALALAGKVVGATAPPWKRLEAICQEFLSGFPIEPKDDDVRWLGLERDPDRAGWLAAAKEALEVETGRWAFLQQVDAVAAPPAAWTATDAPSIDARLRELAAMRDRWDELVMHLGMLLVTLGLWRDAGFASLGHYCEERLGMAESTLRQRAALERRLYELPALRTALRERRVSYEKARLVASVADEKTVEAWIARAESSTCLALRDAVDAEEHHQMCARGEVVLRMPPEVAPVVAAAFRAAREAVGRHVPAGTCLVLIAAHFIDVWKPALSSRKTRHQRVIERDRGRCAFPGCSRAAVHAHHVDFRSHGGPDELENLASLCAVHHLRSVHGGLVRVTGSAPDALVWEVMTREPPRSC